MDQKIDMLYDLKEANIATIYDDAIKMLNKYGYSPYLLYDPYEGTTDISGALILACGGSRSMLARGAAEPQECRVPPINIGKFYVAENFLESIVDQNLSRWCEVHEHDDAVKLLVSASDRINISVNEKIVSAHHD